MSLSKLLFRVVLVFACAALLAGSAHAQFRATIQGTVMDPMVGHRGREGDGNQCGHWRGA